MRKGGEGFHVSRKIIVSYLCHILLGKISCSTIFTVKNVTAYYFMRLPATSPSGPPVILIVKGPLKRNIWDTEG